MKGLVEVGVVREWRRGRRDLAETWFKLELDRAVAMTCKPQPSQGILCDTVFGYSATLWHLDSLGVF